MLKSSTSIVGLLLLACLLGSALALGTGMRQRRDPAQVRTKVLEFLKKSLLKAGHDDHEDHDHFPEPSWFIDSLFANLTNRTDDSEAIKVTCECRQ